MPESHAPAHQERDWFQLACSLYLKLSLVTLCSGDDEGDSGITRLGTAASAAAAKPVAAAAAKPAPSAPAMVLYRFSAQFRIHFIARM